LITPTRTVCICVMDGKYTHQGMKRFTLTPKIAEEINNVGAWGFVKQIIVREEPIEQYHPLKFHTGDLLEVEINPGEIKLFPVPKCSCQINHMCRPCCLALVSYAQSTAWTLPSVEMFGRCEGPQS